MNEIYTSLDLLEKHLEEMKDGAQRTINPIHAIYLLTKEIKALKELVYPDGWKFSPLPLEIKEES